MGFTSSEGISGGSDPEGDGVGAKEATVARVYRWGPEGVEGAAHQCLHLLRPIAFPVQKRVDPPQAAGKVHLDRSLALVCVESAR